LPIGEYEGTLLQESFWLWLTLWSHFLGRVSDVSGHIVLLIVLLVKPKNFWNGVAPMKFSQNGNKKQPLSPVERIE